ncbi:MAG TPA: cardiolipin synthase [Roseiflexaceae bacterium]
MSGQIGTPTEELIGTIIGYAISFGLFFGLQLLALAIIPRRRAPAAAQTWLLLVFFQPLLGWLLYLLIGNPKLSRRRRGLQRQADTLIAERLQVAQQRSDLHALLAPPIAPSQAGLIRLNQRASGFPAFAGNDVEFLSDYDSAIQRIAAEIDRAERYVHMEYYALVMDDATECVFAAMERAAARGVKVRLLSDHLGSRGYPRGKEMQRRLAAAGVEYHRVLPVSFFDREFSRADLRNHRKIVVVDGQVGFTGSQNMVTKTYHRKDKLYYEELVARVSGPIVVQLAAVFATDWYSETGVVLDGPRFPELAVAVERAGDVLAQVLPSGPGYDGENNWKLFVALVHEARRKVVITTPYFVPDEALLSAIVIAAQRGVDVTLIVSGIADQFLISRCQRSYYEELLEAGVQIRLFNPPVLLHSKNMSIDDNICVIGSSNMDIRSFALNLEVTLVIYDRAVVRQLRAIETTYLARSTPVDWEAWQRRPWSQKLVQNTTRLFSAVL